MKGGERINEKKIENFDNGVSIGACFFIFSG